MSPYRDGPVPDLTPAILPDRRRRNAVVTFAAGATLALVVGLLTGTVRSPRSIPTSTGVDQLMAATDRPTSLIRVDGDLVPDSLVHQESPCEYRFSVEKNGFRMPVIHRACVLADPLAAAIAERYAVPVMMDGELRPEGFVATGVLARVPSCCFCSAEGRRAQLKAFMEGNRH